MRDIDLADVSPLTADEAQALEAQYDRIRALLAQLDASMVEIDIELAQALAQLGDARIKVETLKARKSTVVERARNLKTLLQGY